jgi:hypothetical protein
MRVNNREYVRIVHIVGRKRVKHYIGAKDKYVYVEKLHRLDLTNLKDQDPAMLIRNAIDNFIESARKLSIKRDKVVEFMDKTKQLMRVLTLCASNLEKLYSELEQKLKLLESESNEEGY